MPQKQGASGSFRKEWPFFLNEKIAAEAVPERIAAMTNRNSYQKRNAKIPTSTRKTNPGVERLTRHADEAVLRHSSDIAKALADAAIAGNASSARLLIDLADGADWMKDEEAVQQFLKIVESWEKEPKVDDAPGEMPAGVLQDSPTTESARTTYVN